VPQHLDKAIFVKIHTFEIKRIP